jgi:hypothetical protein
MESLRSGRKRATGGEAAVLEIGTFGGLLFVVHARHTQLPWLHDRDSPHFLTDSDVGGGVAQPPMC